MAATASFWDSAFAALNRLRVPPAQEEVDPQVADLRAMVSELKLKLVEAEQTIAGLKKENERCGGVIAKQEKELSELRRQLREVREAHDAVHKKLYPQTLGGITKGLNEQISVAPAGPEFTINGLDMFEQHKQHKKASG